MRSAIIFLWAGVALATTLPTQPDSAKITSLLGERAFLPPGCDYAPANFSELTTAANSATSGQTICLKPQSTGTIYTGKLVLQNKLNAQYITFRVNDLSGLPANQWASPSVASKLAKIVSSDNGPAIRTVPGARRYKFIGLEITTTNSNHGLLVELGLNGPLYGQAQDTQSLVGHHMMIDRCYIHGLPVPNKTGVGVAVRTDYTLITKSWISDIHDGSGDDQTVVVANCNGPVAVTGNFLEAAGENTLVGGSDFPILGINPSDLVFQGNYVYKNKANKNSSVYKVKNHFELKTGQRVLVEGNVFENYWSGVQSQFYSFIMKSANQGSPCGTTSEDHGYLNHTGDVTIRYNKLINVAQAFAIGRAAVCGTVANGSSKFWINNNLILGLGDGHNTDLTNKRVNELGLFYPGSTNTHAQYITYEHNTVGSVVINNPLGKPYEHHYFHLEGTADVPDFTARSNVLYKDFFVSSHLNNESDILNRYPNIDYKNNVVIDSPAVFASRPNWTKSGLSSTFVNAAGGNYRLANPASYPGHDGQPAGADIDMIESCTAGVTTGTWTGCGATPPIVTASITANGSFGPIQVEPGADVQLDWTSSNVSSCTASGSSLWTGSKATSGSLTINPTSNATYKIACTGTSGSTEASVTVNINTSQTACPDPPL